MTDTNSNILENVGISLDKLEEIFTKNGMSNEQEKYLNATKRHYNALCENMDDLHKTLKKEAKINETKLPEYPALINLLHSASSTLISGGITTAIALIVLFVLGGGNPEAWSSMLQWIGFGLGAGVAAPIGIAIKSSNKKHFNVDDPKSQGLIERAIVRRLNKKLDNIASIKVSTEGKSDKIIKGDYKLKETITVKKDKKNSKGQTYTVTKHINQLKEEYKDLPFFTKRKLNKIIESIDESYDGMNKMGTTTLTRGIMDLKSSYKEQYINIRNNHLELIDEKIDDLSQTIESSNVTQKSINEKIKQLSVISRGLGEEMNELGKISTSIKTILELCEDWKNQTENKKYIEQLDSIIQEGKDILEKYDSSIIADSKSIISSVNDIIESAKKKIEEMKANNKSKDVPKVLETTGKRK